MFRHFVGNVYLFDAPPEEDLPFVDIPALNPTDSTPSSLLLQMSKDDLPAGLREKIERLTGQNFLPVAILKAHSGIEPEYLIDTAKYLHELDIRSIMQCSWIARPTYDELRLSSDIIWEKLGGAQSARRAAMRTSSMMTKWIWDLFKLKSVPVFRKQKIINQMEYGSAADEAVENVLAFIRGWASFNYPKYLSALNDVAAFVLTVRGLRACNYIPFAASIEHLFQPDSFSSLEEYGLPTEITERLMQRSLFGKDESLDVIIQRLRGPELNRYADGLFERRIIEDFQSGIGVKKVKQT